MTTNTTTTAQDAIKHYQSIVIGTKSALLKIIPRRQLYVCCGDRSFKVSRTSLLYSLDFRQDVCIEATLITNDYGVKFFYLNNVTHTKK